MSVSRFTQLSTFLKSIDGISDAEDPFDLTPASSLLETGLFVAGTKDAVLMLFVVLPFLFLVFYRRVLTCKCLHGYK